METQWPRVSGTATALQWSSPLGNTLCSPELSRTITSAPRGMTRTRKFVSGPPIASSPLSSAQSTCIAPPPEPIRIRDDHLASGESTDGSAGPKVTSSPTFPLRSRMATRVDPLSAVIRILSFPSSSHRRKDPVTTRSLVAQPLLKRSSSAEAMSLTTYRDALKVDLSHSYASGKPPVVPGNRSNLPSGSGFGRVGAKPFPTAPLLPPIIPLRKTGGDTRVSTKYMKIMTAVPTG